MKIEEIAREMAAYGCDHADPDNDPELVAKFLKILRTVEAEAEKRVRAEKLEDTETCIRKLGYLLHDYPDDKETRGLIERLRAQIKLVPQGEKP